MFFDTETGGCDPQKFDLLQLSYQIVDCPGFHLIKQNNFYFLREREVTSQAMSVNGLSDQFLSMQVISRRGEAMKEFLVDLEGCDMLVAHGMEFDKNVIYYTCRRTHYTKRFNKVLENLTTYDTLTETATLCRLPFHSPRAYQDISEYKYPKLSELADFLKVDISDIKLHDSSSDTLLLVRCFKKLVEIGWVTLSDF